MHDPIPLDVVPRRTEARVPPLPENMVWIPGGSFRMGSNQHYAEEAPAHPVTVSGFWMDRTTITNALFARFVEETDYVTLAERPASPADYPGAKPDLLAPASVVFQKAPGKVDLRNHFNWWAYVPGANWKHPQGPGSSIDGLQQHPVVHVAFEDAFMYASWANKELPTEAEWEFAARGGIEGAEFVWGDELAPDGRRMAKTWQGEFPWQNLAEDGREWTSPVGSFPPNGYGLCDMAGNVWEWTDDWYAAYPDVDENCCQVTNPRGGERGESRDPCLPEIAIPRKVIKGGSFLCSPDYCRRYRPAARMAQPIDTSTCHVGFRCIVRDRGRITGEPR